MTDSQRTILLVEDEALVAMNQALLLQKEGFTVFQAFSGEEAIAKVDAAQPAIDLVLMDINLKGGLDGTQTAQAILQKHDIPVVFLSSHSEPKIVERTEKITSYGYVVKFTGITVLVASIKMAFKLHAAHQAIRLANEKLEREIAERRLAEEALRENETRLRLLSDNLAGGMVYQIDSGEDCQQRQFSYISHGVEQMHGITAEEALKDPMAIYGQVLEEDRGLVAGQEAEAIRAMTPLSVEVRVRPPSGDVRWRLFTSAPRRLPNNHMVWDGVEIDITARKRAEEQLRKFDAQLKTILENSPDTILWVNRERQIMFTSRVLPGFKMDEIIGSSAYRWVPAEQHPTLDAVFDAVFSGGEPGEYETLGPGPHGEVRSYHVLVMPVVIDGRTDSAVLNARDITEQKRVEDELKRAIEEKEILLRELQHRVKNTIATVGALVGIEASRADDGATRSVLDKVGLRVGTLSSLYAMLYSTGELHNIRLDRYIGEVARKLANVFSGDPERLRLDLELDEMTVGAKGAAAFGLIANELLTNAFNHAFPGGRGGKLLVRLKPDGSSVSLEVENDGAPLPEGFDPAAVRGSGLGLVTLLAKQIEGEFYFKREGKTIFGVRADLEDL